MKVCITLFTLLFSLSFVLTDSPAAIENCKTLSSNPALGCQDCSTGFYTTPQTEGSGFMICGRCSDSISNCYTCSDSKTCTGCNDSFYLYADVCKGCVTGCKNCFEKDTCSTCDKGYRLNNGQCVHKWKQMILDIVIWAIVVVPILGFMGIWLFYTIKNRKRGQKINENEGGNVTDNILADE